MYLLYLFALIPVLIGCGFWIYSKKIVWWEWGISVICAFFVSAVMNVVAVVGMTSDTETWSGHIQYATYHPEWVEKYKVAIYRTVTHRSGKTTYTTRVFSHYETRYRTHSKYWDETETFGRFDVSRLIDSSFYEAIKTNFGNVVDSKYESKSGFYSGDHNIYVVMNHTGFIYPTTTSKSFENRVKAAPSLFSFMKVPENVPVHKYPENKNWNSSDRVLGTAKSLIDTFHWDRMNSRLGPFKKVNVIIIGFNDDKQTAMIQEAKWIGGKKNDLILCFGPIVNNKASWSYVFGWTENEEVKRNLETILLNEPIKTDLITKIEEEVIKNYVIKDWKKFDYISIEPPMWSYIVLFIVMGLSQSVVWWISLQNNANKKETKSVN